MASIIKKTIKNNAYYYYVESARVNGKPKYVNQVYLGSAEAILRRLEAAKPSQALYSEIESFADVCLLYDVAKKLSVLEILNECFPKRKQGVSIGTYALIAAINRAVAPAAKANIEAWYCKTILKALMSVPRGSLSCQRFWDNMDSIKEEHIDLFEETFLEEILRIYPINASLLIYDATNFFTFYSAASSSELAKTGHGKDKGTRHKVVGLSMMITPDLNMPLLYDVYPGNMHDSKEFYAMVEKMQARYTKITNQAADITITFDKGNNAEDVIEVLESGRIPLHYVGGLRLSQVSELLEVPMRRYQVLQDEYRKTKEKTKVYRTALPLYGRDLTVLITFSPRLLEKHLYTHEKNIAKTQAELEALQVQLEKRANQEVLKGRQMTEESVTKRLRKILSRDHMGKLFSASVVIGDCPNRPRLVFNFDAEASGDIVKKHLGKRAFFTNRHGWSNEEIVGTRNSAWHVEGVFRQLKNPFHLPIRPLCHWKDQKVRVHIFFCLLAYRLCCILNYELREKGIALSINKMLDSLAEIKKVITIYGTDKSDILISLSKGNVYAEEMLKIYDLRSKYLS